jgi:hypothetical protein
LEQSKYVACVAAVTHHPQRDDYGEESGNVKYHNDSLNEWKLPGKEGIEEKADRQHYPDE